MVNTPTKPPVHTPPPVKAPEHVVVPGQPPKPDLHEDSKPPDEATLPESTRAEMAAGREGLKSYAARDQAEHDAGKKALQEHADTHPAPKPDSTE